MFMFITESTLYAETFYVRVNGSDSNDGLTSQRAFQTIQHAISQCVEPGSTVYIGPGTYYESLYIGSGVGASAVSGTESEPIRLVGDTTGSHTEVDAGPVVLDSSGYSMGVIINSRQYWTLEHLTIQNQSQYGVYGYSDGVSIKSCTFYSPPLYAIYLNPTGDTVIEDCEFVRSSSSGHQIIIVPRSTTPIQVIVTRNQITMEGAYYQSTGLHMGGGRGVSMPPASGAKYGIMITGYRGPSLERIEVSNNIISDCDAAIYTSGHITDSSNYIISNNTITGSFISIYLYAYRASSATITNNAIDTCYYGLYTNCQTAIIESLIEHNMSISMARYSREFEMRVIVDNPLFIDQSNGDFSLEPNSPAIDAGLSTNAPVVDFNQADRPSDGDRDGILSHDIGAFETDGAIKRVRVIQWREIGSEHNR